MTTHKQNRLSSTASPAGNMQPANRHNLKDKRSSDSYLLALEKAPSYVSFRSALQKSVLLCETSMRHT